MLPYFFTLDLVKEIATRYILQIKDTSRYIFPTIQPWIFIKIIFNYYLKSSQILPIHRIHSNVSNVYKSEY